MTAPRTNILLVHAHDLGTWLGCYGDTAVGTPNADRLAREGVRFEQAFATAPLCSPARASLFSGLYPHQHGVTGLAHLGSAYGEDVQTLPARLSGAGYKTALIGLQHEAIDPYSIGFDRLVGNGYPPRALFTADFAADWLRTDGAAAEPFFLTVGMWEPHRPWRPEDYQAADPDAVAVPSWLPDNEHTRADIAAFHGAIEQMDTALGTILDALDETGLADRTLAVFTTDHGPAFPRAKGTLYDAGIRVALIARPPRRLGIEPAVQDGLTSHLDLFETLLDIAGAPPSGLEGKSFAGLLEGRKPVDPLRTQIFAEKIYHDAYDPIRCIRTTGWKYIRNFDEAPKLMLSKDIENSETRRGYGDAHLAPRPHEELYRLDQDPSELLNLASNPDFDNVKAELAGELATWMRATDDPLASEIVVES